MTKSSEPVPAMPEAVDRLVDAGLDGALAGLDGSDRKLRSISLLMLEVLSPQHGRLVEARNAMPARRYRVKA